jgi:hypothetical protein
MKGSPEGVPRRVSSEEFSFWGSLPVGCPLKGVTYGGSMEGSCVRCGQEGFSSRGPIERFRTGVLCWRVSPGGAAWREDIGGVPVGG